MEAAALSALVFVPLLGAAIVLMQSEDDAIWWSAFIFSLIPLALSLYLFAAFQPGVGGYQFVEHYSWIPQFGISYHLGLDGISLFLVILTTLLISLSLLYSGGGDIDVRPREFCFLMLLLETGLLGALVALDLFLFYAFWEVMLVPMYFMIGIWGHGAKLYATFKFILFTMFGSLLMLAAIIYLAVAARAHLGHLSFDILDLLATPLTVTQARWLFAGFAIAFAIKVPMWPVHTWLPDAHTEAPTAGSVILAGIMLKMGGYGFLRFAIPLFPTVALEAAPIFIALAVVGIIYGALVAMVQPDLKRLVAYSSVSHLGFVMLGIFAFDPQGVDGAIYQMLNHGLSTGALFLLVGMLYLRRHTREISEFGGLWHSIPVYAGIFMFVMLASIGLPGLNGFIGEFLILLGTFLNLKLAAYFAVLGLILGALYMLYAYERVMWGPIKHAINSTIADLTAREIAVVIPLIALMLLLGFYPRPLLSRMEPSVNDLLGRIRAARVAMAHEKSFDISSVIPARLPAGEPQREPTGVILSEASPLATRGSRAERTSESASCAEDYLAESKDLCEATRNYVGAQSFPSHVTWPESFGASLSVILSEVSRETRERSRRISDSFASPWRAEQARLSEAGTGSAFAERSAFFLPDPPSEKPRTK